MENRDTNKEEQSTSIFESDNRYSVLNQEANGHDAGLDTSVIEIDRNTQSSSDDRMLVTKESSSSTTESTKQTNVKARGPTKGIVSIGDSIIKNVNQVKISKRKVHKYTW